ncbi:uncharacterized protein GGS22DRAFT_196498 [Annulohypoxylon maeteangense]|uniref:uncharacterized protein n=1 Tax=Annulohypoxylon maeteangense TaxID=1927788 RepID=UPI002008E291|nr:uncharacterized protein GGS22DRAFT_196498 [Annulohypoxylon maeteangense]KAI0881588.1 hypothetical protein GGS22DRAFT_196498 [Annulohypoxylon maeteangense]
MWTPINKTPTPAPTDAVSAPGTPYIPRPGDENAEIPAQELVDEKKAEIIEIPLNMPPLPLPSPLLNLSLSYPPKARDDKDAIDASNIIDERTRHARPLSGTYRMPGDEEGLPVEFVEVKGSGSTDGDEGVDGGVDMIETGDGNMVVGGEGEVEVGRDGGGNVDGEMNGEGDEQMDGEIDMGVVTIK